MQSPFLTNDNPLLHLTHVGNALFDRISFIQLGEIFLAIFSRKPSQHHHLPSHATCHYNKLLINKAAPTHLL